MVRLLNNRMEVVNGPRGLWSSQIGSFVVDVENIQEERMLGECDGDSGDICNIRSLLLRLGSDCACRSDISPVALRPFKIESDPIPK